MKQVFYDLRFSYPDGRSLRVGGFYTRQEAENYDKRLEHGLTFVRMERRCEETTPEEILRGACVVCGEPVDYYDSSWQDMTTNLQRRACRKHPCPDGFGYWTDG